MRAAFWGSALFVAYVYFGYAMLLLVWVRLRRHAGPGDARVGTTALTPADDGTDVLPRVSVVIAARNEARRLPARIDNLLALDYPPDRLEIIVVSDGSTDHTEAALARFGTRVSCISLPASGKAAALNAGVAQASGDVLVFADARQTFASDALRALTVPFADPSIGGVSGELILGCETGAGRRGRRDRRSEPGFERHDHERRAAERRGHLASAVGEGVGLYWRYEKLLRGLESEVGSMLGATGAIYALRRSLWRPLPSGTILDDVLAPMRAVLARRRVVFEPRAQAFDYTSPDAATESRRKIRTLAGNVQILWFEPRLLVPGLNPVWLQYISHKVGRLLVPYALMALFASSIALSTGSVFYTAALLAQCAFYLHSGYGAWLEHWQHAQPAGQTVVQRSGKVAFTIVMMNVSAVAGVGAALLGRRVWR